MTSSAPSAVRQRPSAPLTTAVAMTVAALVVLPVSGRMLVVAPGLTPAWLAVMLICDLVTAVLLLGRSRGGASPRLVVLAAGFVWSSILVVATALAIPGVLSRSAVIGDPDVLWWFWIARHVVPPVCLAVALVPWPTRWRRYGVPDGESDADPSREAHARLIAWVLVPVIAAAVALIVLGVVAPSAFPAVTTTDDAFGLGSQASAAALAAVTAVNVAAVLAALAGIRLRHSGSPLEAWVVVAGLALLGEVVTIATAQPIYTVGYVAGRVSGLLASLVVLGIVLSDEFALHRRTASDAAHLERQNSELRDAAKLRDHLIAVVSHEMRTPLAGLQGYLELMSDEQDADPELSARMLDRSWLLTRRLTLLAEDLLAVATAEHGEIVLLPQDLQLVRQLDETAACFPDLDLRIDCPPGLMVRADTLRLQQVLTNLIRNAQKHGAEPVTVTCAADDARVTIRVADSGPGVPRDFVHLLFERYAQGANRRTAGGSGLGLAVVRDLVRAHGGTVRYDLTSPAFVVTLPAGDAHRPQAPKPVEVPLTSDLEFPATLTEQFDDELAAEFDGELADLVAGIETTAPASALEAFATLSREHPGPG